MALLVVAADGAPTGPGVADAACLYAIYDPVARRCGLARAGHPPPALVDRWGTCCTRSGKVIWTEQTLFVRGVHTGRAARARRQLITAAVVASSSGRVPVNSGISRMATAHASGSLPRWALMRSTVSRRTRRSCSLSLSRDSWWRLAR